MNRPTAFDGGPSPRIADIPGPYWFFFYTQAW